MVEAISSLARSQRQAQRLLLATKVEAMRRAREEVKAQIRREGRIKLCSVPPREITSMAEAYILAHRELIVEARARVEQWRVEGFFGKAVQHSKDLHNARRPEPQALPLCETHDRNGAGK